MIDAMSSSGVADACCVMVEWLSEVIARDDMGRIRFKLRPVFLGY